MKFNNLQSIERPRLSDSSDLRSQTNKKFNIKFWVVQYQFFVILYNAKQSIPRMHMLQALSTRCPVACNFGMSAVARISSIIAVRCSHLSRAQISRELNVSQSTGSYRQGLQTRRSQDEALETLSLTANQSIGMEYLAFHQHYAVQIITHSQLKLADRFFKLEQLWVEKPSNKYPAAG